MVIQERREKRKRRMGEIEECNRRMSISQGQGGYSPLPPVRNGSHNMACGDDEGMGDDMDYMDYGADTAGGGGDYDGLEGGTAGEFHNPADGYPDSNTHTDNINNINDRAIHNNEVFVKSIHIKKGG